MNGRQKCEKRIIREMQGLLILSLALIFFISPASASEMAEFKDTIETVYIPVSKQSEVGRTFKKTEKHVAIFRTGILDILPVYDLRSVFNYPKLYLLYRSFKLCD